MKKMKTPLLYLFVVLLVFKSADLSGQFFQADTDNMMSNEKIDYHENSAFSDPNYVESFLERFRMHGEKIVGGEDVDILDFPWQISLQLQPIYGGAHFCGGTIIEDEWIVTASHCVDDPNMTESVIRIRAGITSLSSSADEGYYHNIEEIIMHPDYDDSGYQYDIALLKLASPVDLSNEETARVPIIREVDVDMGLTDPGQMAWVSGWGSLSFQGPSPDVLQAVEVPIVGGTASYPPSMITPDMMLAGSEGQDACQGDSGGPLVVPDGQGWYKLAGVVSWGNDCGLAGYPGVYARVSYFENWLDEYITVYDPNQYATLYYEDFGSAEDIPEGWENVVVEGPDGFPGWEWTDTGGDYGGELNSTTAHNGYMILDSDEHGSQGEMEEADLITKSFDLSDVNSSALLYVEHWARTFGNADISIYASADDFQTQTELYRWHNAPQNEANGPNPVVGQYMLPEDVLGEANVKIKFKWVGSYDYWWMLDDVKIMAENEPLEIQFFVTDGTVPIDNALVFTDYFDQNAYTDIDGNASITLYEGNYTINVLKEGYFPFSESVDITHDGQVVNLEMEKIPAPEIDVTPGNLSFTVTQGEQETAQLNIANTGDADLEYQLYAIPADGKKQELKTSLGSSGKNKEKGTNELFGKEFNAQINESFLVNHESQYKDSPKKSKNKDVVEIAHENGQFEGNGIGTGGAASWTSAARFTSEDLASYYGTYELTQVMIQILGDDYNEVVVKIWEGGSENGPGSEVYSQDVTGEVINNEWTTHVLEEPIGLIPGEEYWIGYSIDVSEGFPAATDSGPMVDGKGGWMYIENAWAQLVEINEDLDYNWRIRGVLEIGDGPDWISFDPLNGIVEPDAFDEVQITVDAQELEVGNHLATIVVQNNAGESVHVPVDVEVLVPYFDLTFNVIDQDGEPVENAVITLGDVTNAAGDYFFENMESNSYNYQVEKEGYITSSGTLILDQDLTVDVILIEEDYDEIVELTISVEDEFGTPLENAFFQMENYGGHYTDDSGVITFTALPGTYQYTLTKDNLNDLSDSFTIPESVDQYLLELEMMYQRFDVLLGVSPEGAGTVSGEGEYYYGQTATITAEPVEGYHFLNWMEDGNVITTDSTYEFEVFEEHQMVANFELNTYTLSASAGNNGTIHPSGEIEVNHGDDFSFSIHPSWGYQVDDVTVDSESVGPVSSYEFENIDSDGSIHAEFKLKVYDIVITSEGNGSIDPDGTITVEHGTSLTFTLTPEPDHHVEDLLIDGESVGAVEEYEVTNIMDPFTVHAIFAFSVDVETYKDLDQLVVYPNPASSVVKVESDEVITDIRIYSVSGQLMKQLKVNDNTAEVSVAGMPSGIYLLQIADAGGVKTVSLKVE